jgi:hypothetical protein
MPQRTIANGNDIIPYLKTDGFIFIIIELIGIINSCRDGIVNNNRKINFAVLNLYSFAI